MSRSFKSQDEQRHDLLRQFEGFIGHISGVADGNACLLRTICEVAETPASIDGAFGDFMTTLMTPTLDLEASSYALGETDYIQAQKAGYYGRDCSGYHYACPVSFFQVIAHNYCLIMT